MFWVIVVFSGFLIAGILITNNFETWKNNPVSTTIETLPIAKVKFPLVNVCPPQNTFTTMNYDLVKTAKATFDKDIRDDLATLLILDWQDEDFTEKMEELSSFKEKNKYLNWYLGYSELYLPSESRNNYYQYQYYYMYTAATDGSFSSPWFGEQFTDKFEMNVYWGFRIWLPAKIKKKKI